MELRRGKSGHLHKVVERLKLSTSQDEERDVNALNTAPQVGIVLDALCERVSSIIDDKVVDLHDNRQ